MARHEGGRGARLHAELAPNSSRPSFLLRLRPGFPFTFSQRRWIALWTFCSRLVLRATYTSSRADQSLLHSFRYRVALLCTCELRGREDLQTRGACYAGICASSIDFGQPTTAGSDQTDNHQPRPLLLPPLARRRPSAPCASAQSNYTGLSATGKDDIGKRGSILCLDRQFVFPFRVDFPRGYLFVLLMPHEHEAGPTYTTCLTLQCC
ncbi:hypothetical protein B0T22DRAFT_288341 [Podospora appendiculata]|uniref:Uncharacterized protein n=1 Tax=Podospora appendiculata TaxID=314037 RepID=A0AAE1C874_9PEZI|nr:hypothetical protein B0T22DRAFT_288341 [Podospora appendiculata]